MIEHGESWDKYLPLIEFACNNNFHVSISMVQYEALYGRKCQSPMRWCELGEASLLGSDLVRQITEQVKKIGNKILTA